MGNTTGSSRIVVNANVAMPGAAAAVPEWWSQVRAIARYEGLLLGRSRGFIVVLLALLTLSVVNIMIVNANLEMVLEPLMVGGGDAARLTAVAAVIVFLTWSPLGVSLGLLVPLLVADAVPKDRLIGIRELFESLPLTHECYLSGKLLGNCLVLFAGIGGVLVMTGVLWWATIGAYDVIPMLVMYGAGVGTLIFINCGLAIILGASQPDRRRAVGLILLLMIIGAVVTLPSAGASSARLQDMLSPLRLPILNYFLMQEISHQVLLTTIGVGFAQLVIACLLMSGWLRWQIRHV